MINYGIEVKQNRPNPFSGKTTVEINVSDGKTYKLASIRITDIYGKVIRETPVSLYSGKNEIVVAAPKQGGGSYFYSLLISGKTIYTGKMVVIE